jgi:hypothetical protein
MREVLELDPAIARLVKSILSEATARGSKELQAWKRPEHEINRLFERDYARSLRKTFATADMKDLVGAACAIWPNFNRSPMGPPSMQLFAEVSAHLRLHFSSAPYRKQGGFAVRGFYVNKTPAALGKPLIYVNSAHHLLAVGTAFCHEVGHHLSADMFRPAGEESEGARLYFGAEYSAHLDEPGELAADVMVSLAGYPKPLARQIFASAAGDAMVLPLGARGGKAFAAVREHLRSRYRFDFAAVLPPAQKLHYLTGMIHYARLREALMAEYDL